jgi:hypothetical protein
MGMDQDLGEHACDHDAFVSGGSPKPRNGRRMVCVEPIEVRDQDACVQD